MNFVRRVLAASTFTCLAGAGILLWLVYQERHLGISSWTVIRCLFAGVLIFIAVLGTRIRHERRSGDF
jgi:hypothetical protein